MRALAPLGDRRFAWFFAAQLVNLAGTFMNSVALAFAVLEVSSSATALGTVLAAHSIPMVLFLLLGGVIADRFGRTTVIQVSNVAAGITQLATAALVLGGHAQLWQLAALTAVNGVVAAAGFPALASVVPQLVPRAQLQQATVLVSLQRNALRVVGPAAAGVLVVTLGAGWALAFDGVTYLVSAALLTMVRLPPAPPRADGPSTVTQLREGWTYVRTTTWLWVVVAAFGVLNALTAGGFHTLGPVLAKSTDAIGESGWGLVLSAEAVGLVAMSVVFLTARLERPLLWGMLAISLNALPMIALGLDPTLVALVVTGFVAGAATEVFGLGWTLAMQEHVPEAMLSRAFSYDALGSLIAIPIGQLAAGAVAAAYGVRPTVLVAGIAYVVVCLLALAARSVRSLERADRTAPSTGVRSR